ncbi:MBL fold metallo-hydrolase [Patescibacteria group bacterium]|nr:MBL fold metallo-hydrolase [Patescibacteria group bacterium]
MNSIRWTLLRIFPYFVLLLLLAANVCIYLLVAAPLSHGLKVSILNIGQGDSILVQGPTGITMLVDAGPNRSVLTGLGTELGPLNRHLDIAMETHPDADHITGLEYVLKEYQVSTFITPGIPDKTITFNQIESQANALPNLKRITARRGMRIDLGGGAYADVLHPDRDMSKETATNDGSITMHVVYGNTSFLLTGDLPSPVEDWLIKLDAADGELKSDVLKVGHHGSKYSTSDEWLAAVNPKTVAISVGKDNRYGHPAPDTLARIQNQGAKILATEDLGTIDFISDGKTITEKSQGL